MVTARQGLRLWECDGLTALLLLTSSSYSLLLLLLLCFAVLSCVCVVSCLLLQWLYDHLGRLRPWISPRQCVTVSSSGNSVYLTLSACVTDNNNQKWYT